MRLGHPPGCTCPIYTDPPRIARLNQTRAEALKEWSRRVTGRSRTAATHAADADRTRCGFILLDIDVERPGCATVDCNPCLNEEAAETAKIDGRRIRTSGTDKLSPESLAGWAEGQRQEAFEAAIASWEPVAAARAMRRFGLTTNAHLALLRDLVDQLDAG
ncbi:hypothetical protein [Kitasatospora sp. MBT63]|uniref:hypothetical protein n=1 Tax=Kitasatospora sp. MBT63 TaxID=1444768 RepID=UPI000539C95E|nr:hypothetical protein [Kitasatospora sp. MBT63]